ncbi:type IX secretion system membrane protein PorP/SprF [Reichenbachiella carrageenanivorans]|uniref:Type IX secretion system membrane protein PorP/SprF n=1 Tax=Reichenbachiella carrageenanivorans TaxID=2979869 RepID=A0ABY6CY32_9BACT|nr:type IX secretion system membrane protein PorP/SprF [Reichenbachiella carrageenanivorans]UXX78817.1 type IX secretion system membrane protein PorP/SprF [Reichenbachiella carrageenanivorans]
MKTRVILLLVLVKSIAGLAQQVPVLSTYTYNLMTVNPAYAGYYGHLDVALEATRTVPFIEGGSQFGNFTINSPVGIRSVGLGATITSDKVGVYSNTEFSMAYSYKLFSRNRNSYTSWGFYPSVLSFGIQAGMSHVSERLTDLGVVNDPEYAQDINTFLPTIGMGVFYSQKHFYVGLSAPRITGSMFSADANLSLQNHYYLQAGYKTALARDYFLKPAMLVKYVSGAPIQFDVNAIIEYSGKFEAGVGYRSVAGVNFLIGLHITNQFFVVYHYDTTLDQNPNAWSNMHGLMIKYNPFHVE